MNALALSFLIFISTLTGIALGALLRRALPKHHLSKDTQDVVRLGVGLIATVSALVLGLLIAAAKSSFDTKSNHIRQITADIILIDNLLAHYGPEAYPIRAQIRGGLDTFADRLWREGQVGMTGPFEASADAEKIYLEIQALSPANDLQRSLQSRAVQLTTDIAQTRLLLFEESGGAIPTPFLGILAFWLVIIFSSFSLFSPLNATAYTCLCLFALSASCAIFLIFDLSQPFSGLMMISSTPLRHALTPL